MIRIVLVLLLSVVVVYGGGTNSNEYLRIGVGERACSMGGAFTGLSDDGTAMFWNPAGATQLQSKTLTLGYTAYVADIKLGDFAYTVPMGKYAIGVGFHNLFVEDMARDIYGNNLGTFTNNYANVGMMLSYKMDNGISVGGTVKALHEQLYTYTSNGVAMDLGAMMPVGGISLGMVVRNIGTSETGTLPTDVRFGIGYAGLGSGIISSDIDIPVNGKKSIMVGGEYNVYKSLFVRGGYRYQDGGSDVGTLDGLNAGLGFSVGKMLINYGFAPFGDYATIHRMSINTTF
jgi:long-subunit fatty acid transport protein